MQYLLAQMAETERVATRSVTYELPLKIVYALIYPLLLVVLEESRNIFVEVATENVFSSFVESLQTNTKHDLWDEDQVQNFNGQ